MSPVSNLHTFGWNKEATLRPRLEEYFGELAKTTERYAHYDYLNKEYQVELKSRRKYDARGQILLPSTYDTWLLPTCKKPSDTDKRTTVFVYYFEGDDSLWYIVYDTETFETFPTERPFWHPTKQEHWMTPSSAWTKFE
jgi:hypothetical protein